MSISEDRASTLEATADVPLAGRVAAVAVCLLLAVWTVAELRAWTANRADLLARIERVGVASLSQEAVQRLLRERTPHHAQLAAARALVNDVLALDPEAARQGGEAPILRLREAADLARRALAAQPNSWQASMLLGAAIYLERSLARDTRLFSAAADWEVPLRKAVAETAGQIEPRRLLATAYLETWRALAAEKREAARELLREVFRDDETSLKRLAPLWLGTAASREEGFALIPEQPEAWRYVASLYQRIRDWESFALAWSRRLDALERRLTADLAEAEERLRLGDVANGRELCLKVVAEAPPSRRFLPLAIAALELYPPGLHGRGVERQLAGWLRWALALDTVGVEVFPGPAVSRLSDAISSLTPAEGAYAALLGDDVYRMRRFESQAGSKSAEEWAPYLLAKARWLAERDLAAAEKTLGEVAYGARGEVAYWLARRRLAEAADDPVALAAAEEELAKLRRREWTALDWRLGERAARLVLLPDGTASSIEIEAVPASPTGAAVEVLWDGVLVAVRPVYRGRRLVLPVAVDPGPHLLEIRALAQEEVAPGEVALRPADQG